VLQRGGKIGLYRLPWAPVCTFFLIIGGNTMRKQDRIANQESRSREADKLNKSESQDRERIRSGGESEPGKGESERMTGGGSDSPRSQRQSGKLPLPD
jgi:hypothetical protein